MKTKFLKRVLWLMIPLLTIFSTNAWGTYTITFNGSNSESTSISTSTTAASITGSSTYVTGNVATATKVYGATSDGIKLGASSSAGTIKIDLSASGQVTPTSIVVNCKLYNSSKSATLKVNGSDTQNVPSTSGNLTFNITSAITYIQLESSKYIWVKSVTVNTAAAGTSVTASPSSIAFPDNTVEVGTDEATSTITLSNGYASYGNYLYGWFEDLSDEDHCEFFVNDDYTYRYSTSGNATPTLTFSYLADAAGTYTGKFIIQGYNSSYTAVNCTIPLSVTLTSSCSSAVSIATGSPTNCTISASAASVSTCSGTRQVTISVTPNSCYAAPVKASVTSTGTTATWVSGPTLNSDHYDYVYSFAENATGTTTFNCSLSTKTTYTVRYETGATTCTGSNAISGSHANDTKTCGSGLTLPGATFTTTGYTQTGWSKTSCGSQYAEVGGSYTDNAAQTFYPVWTPNNYTVTWMVNGEVYTTGTPSDNANYGTKVTTLPTAPTPPCGDVFVGWSTTNIGSTGLDKDDDAAAITALNLFTTPAGSPIITGNTVFYAVFADYAE